MDKPTPPPSTHETTFPQKTEKPKRASKKNVEKEDVIAGVAAASGIVHLLVDVPEKLPETPEGPELVPDQERPDWKYTAVGKIVSETTFHNESYTGGTQNAFVDLFQTVFSSSEGNYFYFDTKGNILLTAQQPETLRLLRESIAKARKEKKSTGALYAELKKQTQAWHNENRKKISKVFVTPADYETTGYPFIATPTLPGVEVESENSSLIQVVMDRLQEKTKSPETGPFYFTGEERTIYDGIVEIAKAYDMPRAIVLGVAANESGYDREAISSADARGIFQFTKAGFEDAKKYIEQHPELGAPIRSGAIGTFDESWKNRFISAELFCAYYRVIQDRIRDDVESLERRLSNLDIGYQTGTLLDIATINAYNAGATRIADCIARFLSLTDNEIKSHIGEPPYGIDAWLGVTSLSFGLSIKNKSTLVGPDVFMYPQKVLAMGALIMEEKNYLSVHEQEREEEIFSLPEPPTRRGLWQGLMVGSGISALAAGLFTGSRVLKQNPATTPDVSTRRDFLRTGAAALGILSPAGRAGKKWFEGQKQTEPEVETPPVQREVYPTVVTDGKQKLDELYAVLEKNTQDGKTGWTADEQDAIREFTAPKNRELLADRFEEMMGKDLLKRFEESESQSFPKRKHLYDEAISRQNAYVEQEKQRGNLIQLLEEDPTQPYFCEQVGVLSGIKNNPDSLYVRKEFKQVLGTLIELMNYQIDTLNRDPSLYGINDTTFPPLPHISAIKISGALRSVESTKRMFEQGLGGRTTPGASAHWLGYTLDIGSFATQGSHMVRLDGDLQETKNGKVKFKRGEKLPSQGFGKRTREIYSKMIGRALFAMRDSLKQQGIEIQPLWEGKQLNWHIAMEVQE